MAKTPPKPTDYIAPLNMNGLQGRMMRMPAPKNRNREILMLYGHHSSLERWFGLAQVFNRYGAVTMPDMPGFGGMDSFYKLGKKPTIDNFADYLAAFVKLQYKRRRVTIVGMSFGFVIATRMLQRYPDLAKRVDLLISLVGFAHHDDFIFSKQRYWTYRLVSSVLGRPGPIHIFRTIALRPVILRMFYGHTHNAKNKFQDVSPEDLKALMDIEIWLWHNNDIRTWLYTTTQILKFSNCHKRIDLPVWHVGVKNDHFLSNDLVEQHMHLIFNDFYGMKVNTGNHAPTVIASAKDATPFIPPQLRKKLLAD